MNKQDINFSFIIPHKNIPDLLQRCIDSIPDREDTEIIIVDDNSSPDKVDFDNFPGSNRKNVRIVYNKDGGGAGAARNIGWKQARGTWLLFADSDDTYTNNLNKFLDDHVNSEADVIYFKANVIPLSGDKKILNNMNLFIDEYYKGNNNVEDIKFGSWEPWNKLIRRSIVVDNNITFDEISTTNDKMFSLKLGMNVSKVEVSNAILYNYILRKGSIIHSKKKEKFYNSFNTFLTQNSLYKKVGYKRKVFIPYFLLKNLKFVNREVLSQYWAYLQDNKANPFEGFIHYFAFHSLNRIKYKN